MRSSRSHETRTYERNVGTTWSRDRCGRAGGGLRRGCRRHVAVELVDAGVVRRTGDRLLASGGLAGLEQTVARRVPRLPR